MNLQGHTPEPRAIRVLVVDDDEDIRDSTRELLELEGFDVRTAEHGQAGLVQVLSGGRPCLVLLDLMMPVMNGLEFLQALRSHPDPDVACTPVVVVSALEEARELRQRFDCEVLRKPVDMEQLLQAVHRHCG